MAVPVTVTRMTFDDEFNTFSNSPEATSGTWQTRFPYPGVPVRTLAGNGEKEYYSDSSVGVNPFSVSGGVLTISATPGSNAAGLPYNSGMISSYGSFSQTYGYFEANMQLPLGKGLWPAFWMLPESNNYTSELDVTEVIGSVPNVSNSTVHGMYSSGWQANAQGWYVPDTTTGFHTYGVDWEPGTTTFYVDGQAMGSVATPDSMNSPMYMILNLAVGGSWPGSPDGNTVFPAQMKIDYVRAYATANTRDVSGRDAIAQASTPVAYGPTTIGSGSDSIALSISENAYLGDAQFTVSVDGTQIGGIQTAHADHAAGQTQLFNVLGSFGAGIHTVAVNFLNDAWGGSAAADRNLYLDGATVIGAQASGAIALTGSGAKSFSFGSAAADASTAVKASNTLTVKVSEDAWHGDAQFLITVDGKQVGGANTVTAAHAAGATQDVVVTGNWGAGAHDVGITFINDAWGGSASADRNLYVSQLSYDGRAASGAPAALFSNGSKSFAVAAAGSATAVEVRLSEDAYKGNAQYSVSIDGQQMSIGEVTASHALGQSQSVAVSSLLSAGTHDLAISFLNDAYGGSAASDRNLYVGGINVNGNALPNATVPIVSTGTQHFAFAI